MKRSEKIFTVTFLAIILFFMGSIVLRTFTRQVLVKRLGLNNAFTAKVLFDADYLDDASDLDDTSELTSKKIDWAVLYPFSEDIQREKEAEAEAESEKDADRTGVLNKPISLIERTEEKVDIFTSEHLIWHKDIIEIANHLESLLRWNYVPYSEYNGIITTNDGYLTSITEKKDISEAQKSITDLFELCNRLSIQFLYVNAPSKVCKFEDPGISGVLDFANQNADDFLASLKEEGIPYCDLRELLHAEGFSHHEMFYVTDHHWRPETGLWAARKIAAILNEDYDFSFDISTVEDSSFTKVFYPSWFLGSQGKKVTLAKAAPEEFTLLFPNYPTNLHYEVLSEEIEADGDFSVMYDMREVNERDYYGKSPYGAYFYADKALERVENKDIDEDRRILVIHDSFGTSVVPFLTMGIKYVDAIDLRHFTGSLRNFIETTKPDAVIVLYNPGALGDANLFDFR